MKQIGETPIDKIIWYVIATLTTIVLTIVGAWGYEVNSSVKVIEDRQAKLERQYDSIESKLNWMIKYWYDTKNSRRNGH
jgi:hypothetical protein